MRTGTSTWTSRNGRMRMRRMYCSRLIRLAARSNWLSTIDFPVIVRGVRAVAVTKPPSGSVGREAAPGQPARWMLCGGQCVGDVQSLGPPAVRVREHTDHVRTRGEGALLEHEHQAARVLGNGGGDSGPPRVRRLWALRDHQGARGRLEARARDERDAQGIRQRVPNQ